MAEILEELQPIFRDVMDNQDLTVDRSSSAANVEGWDSLAHLNLMAAIEQHFGIRFDLSDLEEMKNVGEMVDLMEKKIRKN